MTAPKKLLIALVVLSSLISCGKQNTSAVTTTSTSASAAITGSVEDHLKAGSKFAAVQTNIPEAPAGFFINSQGYAASPVLSQHVWQPNTFYSIDWGQPIYDNNNWQVVYGMVSDKANVFSCDINGYSEDVWIASGDANGFTFSSTPDHLLISSLDMVPHFGQGAMRTDSAYPCKDDARCSGYNIGEPSLVQGKNNWYMFFDSQTCLQAQHGQQFGIIIAISSSLNYGWAIQQRLDDTAVPGKRPLRFPRTFKDPKSNEVWLYYQDEALNTYAVKMIDNGTGINFDQATLSNGPLVSSAANILSVAYDPKSDSYFATADNFGTGQYSDLNTIWLLGLAKSPTDFKWSDKVSLLKKGDWFSGHVRSPYLMIDSNGKSRMYFWGKNEGGADASDTDNRSVKMGLAYDFPLATGKFDFHISAADNQVVKINYTLPLGELNQTNNVYIALQTDEGLYFYNGNTDQLDFYLDPETTEAATSITAISGMITVPTSAIEPLAQKITAAYSGYGKDLNKVINNNQFQLIWTRP